MSPRPLRSRKISADPKTAYFKPKGISLGDLQEVELMPDELEALKLADLDSLYQADAAEKMGISRQTFGSIIDSAHKKIADALLNAKAICIKCDCKKMSIRKVSCPKCCFSWENQENSLHLQCPKCENKENLIKEVFQNKNSYKPKICKVNRK